MKKVSNWNDITLNQFIEIHQLPKDDEFQYLSLSIIYDVSQDEIDELNINEFEKLHSYLGFMSKLPTKPATNITLKSTNLTFIDDFTKLSLGEWIDIENLISNDLVGNIPLLASILFRKMIVGDDFEPDKIEPYGNFIHHRSHLFGECTMADVYGIIPIILTFRDLIHKNYEGLFGTTEPIDEHFELLDETPQEKLERLKEEKQEKYKTKWGWDTVVYNMAKGDITKFNEIYNLPLVMVLNFMSMQSELKLT